MKLSSVFKSTFLPVLAVLGLYAQSKYLSSILDVVFYRHPSQKDVAAHTTTTTNPTTTLSQYEERLLNYFQLYQYIPPVPDHAGAKGLNRFHRPVGATAANKHMYFPYQDADIECGLGPNYERYFTQDSKTRSRYDEDKILYERLFKKNKNTSTHLISGTTHDIDDDENDDYEMNTFVELGAFDGRQESNTRFYEVCLGWNGLLIEGNPVNYHGVVTNRPGAHKMSFAPSCTNNNNTTTSNGTTSSYIDFFIYPWSNVGLPGHAKSYDNKRDKVAVPCGPLAPVLEDIFSVRNRYGRRRRFQQDDNEKDNIQQQSDSSVATASRRRPRITFFSLDVEGAELLVLNTIDFQQGPLIEVLMIESFNSFCKDVCETRDLVRAKMKREGYQRYEDIVRASDLYIHPESRYQLDTPGSGNEQ